MKKLLKTLPYIAIALLVGVTAVYAGDLIPSGDQEGTNTMHNLQDIYKLATGDGISTINPTLTTSPELIGSGNTLNEVYNALSTEINKLANDKIALGITSFGFTGTLYGDTDPTQVLTTADYPGTATAGGAPAPTFASANQTTYSCEALAIVPYLTLETICGYHSTDGCLWSGSACTGGVKTPANGQMTLWSATASCAEKSDEGSSLWRLPTALELVTHYFTNNNAGNPPTDFQSDDFDINNYNSDYYWSSTTSQVPGGDLYSYCVEMYFGYMKDDDEGNQGNLVRCVR